MRSQIRKTLYVCLFFALVFPFLCIPHVKGVDIDVNCNILEDETGNPIEGAEVQVLRRRSRYYTSRRWQTVDSGISDENGNVLLTVDDDQRYLFVTSYDHPDTSGIDYVPRATYLVLGEDSAEIEIQLSKGASLTVSGQEYLIETTSTPTISYGVIDLETKMLLQDPETGFRYGAIEYGLNHILGLNEYEVVVPVGTPFFLQVRSTTEIEGKEFSHTFVVEDFEENRLGQGESLNIDLREYTIETNLEKSWVFSENVSQVIDEKEEAGFFLSIEKHRLTSVQGLISDAEDYVIQGNYEQAYTRLREAYVELSDINSNVLGITTEALRSVYLLVVFFALSSTVVGYVLYDGLSEKIVSSAIIYVAMLLGLRYLHPGNQLVSQIDYLTGAVTAFVMVQIIVTYLPRLLQATSQDDRVPVVNMVVPIFSIAKRSLKRRGLRFGLTLITILLLVASFISLTSFTSGYGLNIVKISDKAQKPSSIAVRAPSLNPNQALAPFSGGNGVIGPPPLDASLLSWFNSRPDSIVVAPKLENHASKQYREFNLPVAFVDKVPLFGVMGVVPSEEARINKIDSVLVAGRYLSDDELDTVLVSSELADRLTVDVGDSVGFEMYGESLELVVVGILDDELLENLGDVDGGSILPYKIIEVGRTPLDGPDIVTEGLSTCEASETVIVNLETAQQLSGVWLTRLDIVIDEDASVLEYARMVALNKGQRVWASVETGVYAVSLASYYEGKGLPVIIPWVIVILNVIVTMLNSYHERCHDVMIYSSIGMNPRHVSVIFLAEAAVLGLVGGSLGYILGLGAYKVIYILTPALQVKQKISAVWSLGAIGISLTAVFIGGIISQRSSTSITPSLKRKWQADIDTTNGYTHILLPLKIQDIEIGEYYPFVLNRIVEESSRWDYLTKRIVEKREESTTDRMVIDFVYCSAEIKFGGVYTKNKLVIEKKGDIFETYLQTRGNPDDIQRVGVFFRKIGIDYSLSKSNKKGK
jgi:ABC-type lipoprotein release transport system permease subunit